MIPKNANYENIDKEISKKVIKQGNKYKWWTKIICFIKIPFTF